MTEFGNDIDIWSGFLVDSFIDYADKQYNPLMESIIPQEKWRKGSQVNQLVKISIQYVPYNSDIFEATQSRYLA